MNCVHFLLLGRYDAKNTSFQNFPAQFKPGAKEKVLHIFLNNFGFVCFEKSQCNTSIGFSKSQFKS